MLSTQGRGAIDIACGWVGGSPAIFKGFKGFQPTLSSAHLQALPHVSQHTPCTLGFCTWAECGEDSSIERTPVSPPPPPPACACMHHPAGRAKDTLVLLSGKNIEPQPIEDALCRSPFIK